MSNLVYWILAIIIVIFINYLIEGFTHTSLSVFELVVLVNLHYLVFKIGGMRE